jgi:NADPH:quinone reductase-like Zn-dependent oxidoreductase
MQAVFPTVLPAILGSEVAGAVDAIGDGVPGVTIGQEVLGWADTGSYAEYALASKVVGKPAYLDWDAAVALPVAGETALPVLRLSTSPTGRRC